MRSTRLLKIIPFIILLFQIGLAQKFKPEGLILFRDSQIDTNFIRSIDSSGILYLALNDFLKSQKCPASVNDSLGKIECLIDKQLMRFTENNPFVVITERVTNNASIYQMPNKTIRINSEFYVPLNEFILLYDKISDENISFDQQRHTLILNSKYGVKTDISGITIEKKINGSLITILANRKLGDVETWLKPDGWLFVTIASAIADTMELNATKPDGAVKRILAFQSPTSLQLTFRVSSDVVQAETTIEPISNNILISLRTLTALEKREIERKKQEEKKQARDQELKRWKLDVIVIDAGHGGKDPGAIGVKGTKEKDITLSVALKLGQLIENNLKDVKVVYTRKSDEFIELYRRTQIANNAGGKLFISLHCNSTEKKPSNTNGFEIYLLRPGLTEEAITIAARENSVIQLEEGFENRYRRLTEEEFIIVTMAQSAYMKHSEQFAEISINSVAKRSGIKINGVKQAGFYVLVGASMPNVLVELGYLSNKEEEKFLRSYNGQQKIADALFAGIKQFKLRYEETLKQETEN